MVALHIEDLIERGKKSLCPSSWLFILLLLPNKAYSFARIPDGSWNKSWYCMTDHGQHVRTTPPAGSLWTWCTCYRHKAKRGTCLRVFYLCLLSSGKVTRADKWNGKGQQRLIRYPFKEERAKVSSLSISHFIFVPISFNIVIFFWRKCFIKD